MALTRTETIAYDYLRRRFGDVLRKGKGADFMVYDTPCEVKSGIFSHNQIADFISAGKGYLVVVDRGHVLFFELCGAQRVHEDVQDMREYLTSIDMDSRFIDGVVDRLQSAYDIVPKSSSVRWGSDNFSGVSIYGGVP